MKSVKQMMFELNAWATAGLLDEDDTLRCQEIKDRFDGSRLQCLTNVRRANWYVRHFYPAIVSHYGFSEAAGSAGYNPDRK